MVVAGTKVVFGHDETRKIMEHACYRAYGIYRTYGTYANMSLIGPISPISRTSPIGRKPNAT